MREKWISGVRYNHLTSRAEGKTCRRELYRLY